MVKAICSINAVANLDGKGRDDFEIKTLHSASKVLEKKLGTKAVSTLAQNVKTSFNAVRLLGRHYKNNIEMVDPQLRKNEELVKVLKLFEDSWSLAKEFIDDETQLSHLNWFSGVLERQQA
jgi:hypothetical protein